MKSPVGLLEIKFNEEEVTSIFFVEESEAADKPNKIFRECKKQLTEYFKGERRTFDFPFRQTGSAFQKKVWNELAKIPFGKTISYLQLAKGIGDVKAIRAAASANGKNKLPIVVPCHRVIGSDGTLVGYAGGLSRKQFLLEHEAKFASGVQKLF